MSTDYTPGPLPDAWYVRRTAPGMRDDGMRLGPFWKRDQAEEWCDDRHILHALFSRETLDAEVAREMAAQSAEIDRLRAEVERLQSALTLARDRLLATMGRHGTRRARRCHASRRRWPSPW